MLTNSTKEDEVLLHKFFDVVFVSIYDMWAINVSVNHFRSLVLAHIAVVRISDVLLSCLFLVIAVAYSVHREAPPEANFVEGL